MENLIPKNAREIVVSGGSGGMIKVKLAGKAIRTELYGGNEVWCRQGKDEGYTS